LAEASDYATAAAAAGTFLGGLWAALRWGRKPKHEKDKAMDAWQRSVDIALSDHCARLARIEIDRVEQRATTEKLFAEIRAIAETTARIEAVCNTRGNGECNR